MLELISHPKKNLLHLLMEKTMTSDEITEMVRQSIGVDFLGYNDAENLADAVGMPKDSMCFTCSSGNYDSLGIKPDFTKREQVKATT